MTLNDRFDEAEAAVDRGNPWRFREADAPNPLTILVTGWSTGFTKLGEAEFLNGVDRNGVKWSILVGGKVLSKKLIEGLVEEWDDEQNKFVVVKTLGRVEKDEIVSIKFTGEAESASGYTYPTFNVNRTPAPEGTAANEAAVLAEATELAAVPYPADAESSQDSDIPF